MRMRGLGLLKRWLQRAASMLRPGVAILMYHRVHDAAVDPWGLCVSPEHFSQHMEHLRRHYSVLSLSMLTEQLAKRRLPKRSVVLTFDDGYADNLWNAKPILERWDVPATLFVTTGCLGQSREFWWDELSRLLLEAGTLPATLQLRMNAAIHQWELGDSTTYTAEDCRRHVSWRMGAKDDPTPRHALYRSLYELLQTLPQTEQRHLLDQLFSWANVSPEGRAAHRALTSDELISIAEGELFEIGSHSMTHPFLPSLSAAEQRDEITQGKARLEEILGHRISHFCYPHGAYNAETLAIVKSAAFTSACTVDKRIVDPDNDPFQLPRIEIRDWNGDEFSGRLSMLMNYS